MASEPGAENLSRGAPAHPPRRRRRSIWPISDLARGQVSGRATPGTHPLSLRPREREPPRPRHLLRADSRRDRETLNHLSGVGVAPEGRRHESGIQGTPPFSGPGVGDGAAAGLRYGVVQLVVTPTRAPPSGCLTPSRFGSIRSARPRPPGCRGCPRRAATSGTPSPTFQEVVIRAVAEHRRHHPPGRPAHRHDRPLLAPGLLLDLLVHPPATPHP